MPKDSVLATCNDMIAPTAAKFGHLTDITDTMKERMQTHGFMNAEARLLKISVLGRNSRCITTPEDAT